MTSVDTSSTEIGPERSGRYWQLFEDLRGQLGYADYLGALQRYRVEHPRDPRVLEVSRFLMAYPFANRLYPASLDAVGHARSFGSAAILTDGDVVFQPRKIWRSGLYERFDGNVLVYVHKERELDDVASRYPADHYVLVDDKVRILAAVKAVWGSRVTTVWPRQGHYALDAADVARYPAARRHDRPHRRPRRARRRRAGTSVELGAGGGRGKPLPYEPAGCPRCAEAGGSGFPSRVSMSSTVRQHDNDQRPARAGL